MADKSPSLPPEETDKSWRDHGLESSLSHPTTPIADSFNDAPRPGSQLEKPTTTEQHASEPEHERTTEEAASMSGLPLIMLTVGMMAVVFLMNLDHYILATATPRITSEFNSLQDAAWYSGGYYLTNMALLPAFGQLYSLYSVRLIYMLCVVIFEVGSVICAVAPSSMVLILGRLVTGVGGGGLYVGSVVLIGYAIPVKSRPLYISIVTSLDGAATVAGPLLGGLFTDSSLTWRFCFWINLPIGLVAFVIMACFIKDPPRAKQIPMSIWVKLAKVDWFSMSLLLGGFAALFLALEWAGPVYPWSDPHVWGCVLGACLVFALYLWYQYYKGDSAAIPYRVLRQRTVFFSSGFMLLMTMVIGALVYYLPFEFQAVRGTDAQTSGTQILPFLVTLMFSPLLSGILISLLGWYLPFMYLGSVLVTVGAGLLTTLSAHTSQAPLIGFQFLIGLGAGISHQIPYTSVNNALPSQDMVIGSALCSFVNSLGAILGIGSAQAIFAGLLTGRLNAVPGINAQKVILAGPTNIKTAVPPLLVTTVRQAYGEALRGTFILPVVLGGLCVVCSMGMEWKRLKQ